MVRGERFNGISHLVGASLALVGATWLVVLASLRGDPWRIVSFSVYGSSLVLLYVFSTLYHSLRGRAKDVLRKFDHCSIYRARITSLVIYLLMGWLALLAVSPLWHALGPAGFAGLAAGGACYTGGVAFYVTDHKLRHGHGIWHLFVLAGSICHFLTVLLFVA